MSILSLSYWESDVYWCQNNKHFTELAPTKWRKRADMRKLCHCYPMYSLDIHNPITIFFGRSITEKVRNQMMLCFPTSPLQCFCITLRNRKPRRQRTVALCVQHSPTPAVLSTSFLLNHAPNSPVGWTHWLYDLQNHTASLVWVVTRESKRLKKSNSWLNSGNALIQHLTGFPQNWKTWNCQGIM